MEQIRAEHDRFDFAASEHGAQLLRPHPLRNILPGKPPHETKHEGEQADIVANR